MTIQLRKALYLEHLQTWVSTVAFKGWINLAKNNTGNVSYVVPGFHGIFCIPVDGVNHTPEFTSGAGSPEGHERSIACAAGMAVVACQILVDDEFAETVKRDFQRE